MSAVIVRATATRWESDDFPGWMEVVIVDADGQEHRVIEKVPVLSMDKFTSATNFPVELWIRGTMDAIDGERVAIAFAYGVETVDGASKLNVWADNVRWL